MSNVVNLYLCVLLFLVWNACAAKRNNSVKSTSIKNTTTVTQEPSKQNASPIATQPEVNEHLISDSNKPLMIPASTLPFEKLEEK